MKKLEAEIARSAEGAWSLRTPGEDEGRSLAVLRRGQIFSQKIILIPKVSRGAITKHHVPTTPKKVIAKKKETASHPLNQRYETMVDGTKAMVIDIADIGTAKLMIRPFGMEAAKTEGITGLVVKVRDPIISGYIQQEHPEAKVLIRKDGITSLFLKVPYHHTKKVLGKKRKSK